MKKRQWTIDDLAAIDDFMDDVCRRAEKIIETTGNSSIAHYKAMVAEYELIERYIREHKHPRPEPSDAGQPIELDNKSSESFYFSMTPPGLWGKLEFAGLTVLSISALIISVSVAVYLIIYLLLGHPL